MSAITAAKGVFDIVSKVAKDPKAREAIGKGMNILRGILPQDEKDNENETTQKANEDQAKQNEEITDKAKESPPSPEKEPDEEKESTKFRDAENARQEARDAINEDPEKAEGRDLAGQGKMENAKNIIENKDEYSLQGKVDDIREAAEKDEGKSWVDKIGGEKQNEGKSWVDRVTESKEPTDINQMQDPNATPDPQLNSLDSVNPAQTQPEINTNIQELNTPQDPSVNPIENQPNEPIEINNDAPDNTLDTPDLEDRTDNSTFNPTETNEFAMLEEKENNFFTNDNPKVDLAMLDDKEMDRFSNLATDKEYTYEPDDKEDMDNSNDLEDMSFYGDDNNHEDMDNDDGVGMDGGDGGDD